MLDNALGTLGNAIGLRVKFRIAEHNTRNVVKTVVILSRNSSKNLGMLDKTGNTRQN